MDLSVFAVLGLSAMKEGAAVQKGKSWVGRLNIEKNTCLLSNGTLTNLINRCQIDCWLKKIRKKFLMAVAIKMLEGYEGFNI